MNGILADVFALYLKTKNFHWHVSGPHFRDYHVLLDEQADQLYAMTDPIAERIRKVGGSTLKSIGHIARTQRVLDNDADHVAPQDMLAELREDNKDLAARLREAHVVPLRGGASLRWRTKTRTHRSSPASRASPPKSTRCSSANHSRTPRASALPPSRPSSTSAGTSCDRGARCASTGRTPTGRASERRKSSRN